MALCSRWETAVGAAGEPVTAQKVEVGIGQNHDPLYGRSSPQWAVSQMLSPKGANEDRAVCKSTPGELRSQCC